MVLVKYINVEEIIFISTKILKSKTYKSATARFQNYKEKKLIKYEVSALRLLNLEKGAESMVAE